MIEPLRTGSGWALGLALLMSSGSELAAQDSLAIRGGTVHTMVGEPLENGVVVIENGKITAVGVDVDVPIDARVIDATGKVVLPGFVEAHSSEPLNQANETNPNVPYLSVMDGIDPVLPYFEQARRNGVTTVSVVPGPETMIGGRSAIIKTGGQFVESMVLRRAGYLKISLEPPSGGGGGRNFGRGGFPQPTARGSREPSRMGHLAALRHELDTAKGEMENPRSREGDDEENLREPLYELLSGTTSAFVHCETAMDAVHALRLAKDYSLKVVLVLGKECHRAASQIAAAGVPVILDPEMVYWERDERSGEDHKHVVCQAFQEAKVPFTFSAASERGTVGRNFLWYQAATAVKYGMPRDEALRALTLLPAQMLGVADSVGSLEVGKDGDVVILTGDPLQVNTWVDRTIVDGEVVYRREEDRALRRLLGEDS